jgi:hypothetical protein
MVEHRRDDLIEGRRRIDLDSSDPTQERLDGPCTQGIPLMRGSSHSH